MFSRLRPVIQRHHERSANDEFVLLWSQSIPFGTLCHKQNNSLPVIGFMNVSQRYGYIQEKGKVRYMG